MMKTFLVILSLSVLAVADKLPDSHGHSHHANHQSDHHATPTSTYSQPAPAAPAAVAPAAPTYSQPSAAPVDNGYYYYYYPVEQTKKEKDLFGKIKDEYDNWKLKASKWELTKFDTKTIIVIALIIVGLLLLGPTIASLLGLGTLITGISTWINNLIANTGNGREIEINIDDVMRYAKTVYKAINKKY